MGIGSQTLVEIWIVQQVFSERFGTFSDLLTSMIILSTAGKTLKISVNVLRIY